MTPVCSVPWCTRPQRTRGWCGPHYTRWRRHGDPLAGGRPDDTLQRLRASIDFDGPGGCWLWKRRLTKWGYGQFQVGQRMLTAHRVVYAVCVAPIPDGLPLDHLCRVRHCVNPMHLEPVTTAENNRRSSSPTSLNAQKTHCKNGHPFDAVNTMYRRGGGRTCRECARIRFRRYYARVAS